MKRAFIITNPMTPLNRSSEVTTSKFIRTVRDCYQTVTLIGGNVSLEEDLADVQLESYAYDKTGGKLRKLHRQFALQRRMANYIETHVQPGDHVIFWLGDKMLLPFWKAKHKTDRVGYFVYGNVAAEGKGSLFMRLSAGLIVFMANHADRVFAESRAVRDGWSGRIKKEAFELHLYTDMIDFNPLENRRNTFGMLCRLASVKHVLEAIRAFHAFRGTYPDWSLELIGSGVQQEACRALIEALGEQDHIRLFGWVDHDRVRKITNAWTYNLLASDHEGLPNSMIEMMGKGVPIIATPVGGIPDLLRDGENGFVLRGTSVDAIREGLERAVREDCYPALCQVAYQTVKDRFSLSGAKKDAEACLSNW